MGLYVAIFVVGTLVWAAIGYRKGAPHGLGVEGIGYSMMGLYGMRKLDQRINKEARSR